MANSVGYRIHGKEMQSIKVKKSDYKLLSLNFLFNKEMKYDIKCKDYCVIYTIKKSEICNIIQSNPYNYQFYCMTKDKYLFDPDQFETF